MFLVLQVQPKLVIFIELIWLSTHNFGCLHISFVFVILIFNVSCICS